MKHLNRLFLLCSFLFVTTLTHGQVMLRASFSDLRTTYQRSSDFFGWEEKLAEDGTPMVTYRDSRQPKLLICCYLDRGVVQKYGWIGQYDQYFKFFGDFCNQSMVYKGGNQWLDKENSCIWTLKTFTDNPSRVKWGVGLFAEPI
ncbi:hypothetical protein EJV47_00555 [Hymenobacter gummosus]|uniref:Uncharacterized protein n=1 Tax=Hymenobacter gummosus TaxID=1776032 RepID=A0A3S0JD98_9BACT|nr:hypothetical protein [Hymenobacter gummosus]RTQ53264.1 hypothetical protein EJV47_00555 [Hymenobacter gummosus]